jgi:hypothetical protein
VSHILGTTHRERNRVSGSLLFVSLLAIVVAVNAGLICGSLAKLSWQNCLMVVFAAAVLAEGAVCTAFGIWRLGR